MAKVIFTLIVATALTSAVAGAQQGTSNAPQPSQTQATLAPCTPVASSTNATNIGSMIKPTDKTQKAIAKERKKWSDMLGFDIPDPTQLTKLKKTPPPCPPAQPNTQLAPVLQLPPDVRTTIRCNPFVASPKPTPGNLTGFTLPDPHEYGVPGPNQFEADNAPPGTNAKTPCYALKVDPKTGKYFVAQ